MSTNNLATTTRSSTAAVDYFESEYSKPTPKPVTPQVADTARRVIAKHAPTGDVDAILVMLGLDK